jgi:glycosyltransferase involved in cell wall biosynthesis
MRPLADPPVRSYLDAERARRQARSGAVAIVRPVARWVTSVRTARWPAFSRFFAVGDLGGWSVDEDAEHIAAAANRLGLDVGRAELARFVAHQSVFLTSHFDALSPRWLDSSNRLATAYLHGRPGTPGFPEFDECFAALCRLPDRLARIQVTHAEMHELVLSARVPEERVFRIPIGIEIERFPFGERERKRDARSALGIPASAFVVGSFQKDGVGWGEGLEPKLVKGPDVLVAVLEQLRGDAPELFVVLTGPARGYVRRELERREIAHTHVFARSRSELARVYHALDAYIVSSRQEGGPKAVLEAMATGVPVVSTRVGQAQEIIDHGRNGLLVDVDDIEALASAVQQVRAESPAASLRDAGRATAERYAYERLDTLWATLLEGFVSRAG